MINTPCTWFGITTHASNVMLAKCRGMACQHDATISPHALRRMTPASMWPSTWWRRCVTIVTKYAPGVA